MRWQAPTNTGRPAIIGYDIQYRVVGSQADFTYEGHDGTGTTATINDLTPNTLYEVRVRAHNDEGASPWSISGTGRTRPRAENQTSPNQPPQFGGPSATRSMAENTAAGVAIGDPITATGGDNDQLIYSLSGTDAGSFEIDPDSGQLLTKAGVTYDYEARSKYSVTVTAEDDNGESADIEVSITLTDEDEPPHAPDAPTVTGTSPTSVEVTWTSPDNAGRPAITDYDIQYRQQGEQDWTSHSFTGTETTTTISDLKSDTTYQVQVAATNDEGTSAWSNSGTGRTNQVDTVETNDDIRPTVTIDGPTTVQTGPFDITITFSEDVTDFIADDIAVGNGSATAFSGSDATYKATITPTASGTVTIDIPENVAEDSAGNGNEAAQQFSVTVDVDAPTVTITGPTDVQTGPFDITITFSEDVTGFIADDIAVGNGSATAFSGSDATYKATITPTASGTVTIDIPENVAEDSAGNPNQAAEQFSVTTDMDPPTVTITGPADVQTGPFDITITFSEDVTDFIADDITVGNGSATAFSGSDTTYKATITPTTSGTVTVDVPESVAEDSAGNLNEAAEQFSVTADMDPPTVAITGPTTVQAGAFDITITFSEDVTDFIADDIAVGNGSATTFSGSDATYKATITPTASGTVTIDIPEKRG